MVLDKGILWLQLYLTSTLVLRLHVGKMCVQRLEFTVLLKNVIGRYCAIEERG